MLKYVSKLAMDILPSVVATIIGAYIVNHYIATKPGADAPVAAAVSLSDKKVDGASSDVANLPTAGVRAKGISEKAIFDKSAAVKPADKPQEKLAEKPSDKSSEKSTDKSLEKSAEPLADKPTETASIPPESRPRSAAPHEKEKSAIRTIPLTSPAVQPAASAVVAPAPTIEAAVTPEDRRDANELARAAIERLRASNGGSPRAPETTRAPETPKIVSTQPNPAAPVFVPPIRPLPPPIMVSTPPADSPGSSPVQPYVNAARSDDPRRPTPPADIPPGRPLDLNAGPADPLARQHTNVAEDMLLAAKSVFHAVLPQ